MPASTPILDNFNRANGAPGANWPGPIRSSRTLFTITSNAAACANGAGATEEGYWTASVGANQECFLTVSALPSATFLVRLHARIQNPNTASPSSYLLEYTHGAPGTLTLYLYSGGAYTQIGSVSNTTLAAGDKMLLRCVGATISGEVYQSGSWSQVASGTDSNIAGAGYIGLALDDTPTRLDDFGGGLVVASRLALLGVG